MNKIQNNNAQLDPPEETNMKAVFIIVGIFLVGFIFLYYAFAV